MNQAVEQKLADLVEELTTSGSRMLKEEKIKQLKQICKQTDVNVEYCFRLLHAQLAKDHSEIRYSAFQIIDQLFQRSHHFRTLLLSDFNYVIDKSLGMDVDNQLPPPHATARLLRQFAATSMKKWHEKFGTTYKLLDVGFNYLKNCKCINFENIDEPIGITAEVQREREQANQVRLNEKLQTVSRELNETSAEIYSCIQQAENCLDLLVPKTNRSSTATTTAPVEEEDDDDDDDDDDDGFIDVPSGPATKNDQELLQLLGLGTAGKLNITVDLNARPTTSLFHINLTDDNRVLIENLHDFYRQLNDVYLPKIQTWMNVFIKVQQNSNEQQTATVIKRAIDLKNAIQMCLRMIDNYHLAPKRSTVTPKPVPKTKVTSIPRSSPSESTTAPPTLTEDEINFFFNGDSDCLKRTFKQSDVQNAFVRPVESNDMPETLNHSVLMRKRTFVNELPPIKWKCRAPMGNGKLCERMDRYKCPFHGRIIARDELGQAVDETIRVQEEETARKRSMPDWQDPEMLEDIRRATGIDLRMDAGKKKKKKTKKIESGLTELGVEESTPRNRLEKKLFNRASLKRIGASLEADERRRNEEKFHHQFNYSLNS